ncbi:MAG: hypothetical protein ACK2U5_17975, partial [Candidatus Promineifilaceae bacterium]
PGNSFYIRPRGELIAAHTQKAPIILKTATKLTSKTFWFILKIAFQNVLETSSLKPLSADSLRGKSGRGRYSQRYR